ncbi:MAG: hypothetical protein GXP05_04225 [Alphaproteobacteria bacterium]|nr:hypothetical protein [Alphaproteobacteria bacterium]
MDEVFGSDEAELDEVGTLTVDPNHHLCDGAVFGSKKFMVTLQQPLIFFNSVYFCQYHPQTCWERSGEEP